MLSKLREKMRADQACAGQVQLVRNNLIRQDPTSLRYMFMCECGRPVEIYKVHKILAHFQTKSHETSISAKFPGQPKALFAHCASQFHLFYCVLQKSR